MNALLRIAVLVLCYGLTSGTYAQDISGQAGPVRPPAATEMMLAEPIPAPLPDPGDLRENMPGARPGLRVRIKDITHIQGRRTNKLTGMGLVIGLNGTGGKSPITRQFAQTMTERFGMRAEPDLRQNIRTDTQDKTNNLSVVVVTAEVDISRHKKGNQIDVIVAAFDDATSLQGGLLVLSPLYGIDGEVYALASGPISIGGFSFSGDAASVQKNHPTTGRVPNGATIEKDICNTELGQEGFFRLHLNEPDLETASRIARSINRYWPQYSRTLDAGSVEVAIPPEYQNFPQDFVAAAQSILVIPDIEARVVVNERTGTVVVGDNVRLSRIAITHANLAVVTGESPLVSQPLPRSRGSTVVVPRTEIDVFEESASVHVIDQPVTVGELARALNSLGVTPRDLSSIFQQLRSSGALHAKLEFQ